MRIGPLIRIAWYFLKCLLLRLLGRERGLARFEAGYCIEDGLLPVSEEERRCLRLFSGCIACGMCDARFSAYACVARPAFRGPSDLPLSYSRGLPDYGGLAVYLNQLARGDLDLLERVCPARIPFRELLGVARRRAEALGPPEGERPSLPRLPHDPG